MKTTACVLISLGAVIGAFGTNQARAESNVEDKVKQLEQEWAEAGVKRDTAVYDRLEADDFVSTDPAGHVGGKSRDLSDLKSGNFTAQTMKVDDMKVQVHGNVAVVIGRTTISGGKYGGQDISGEYRFTDVWVNHAGRWQVVASQGTQVKQ
ncbi:MAG: nuclear transport factor 2 family protein [Bryobacteraceae bacterium]